jgi:hypothetical protein
LAAVDIESSSEFSRVNLSDVNEASNIKAKAGCSKAKAKAIDININEAFNAKVK